MTEPKIVSPVTKGFLLDAEELATKAGKMEEQIVNRLEYIMQLSFQLFGQKKAYWYFHNAEEGEVGDFWRSYDKDQITMVVCDCNNSMLIIDKTGSDWGIADSVPTRWLFEDFEQELINGKKKYEDSLLNKKAKKEELDLQKKKEDALLIEQAKKKLSPKELAAIKRSL